MQDRKLVLVVQGDEVTTSYHLWLETPCDEHQGHVMKNGLLDVDGVTAESPHTWIQVVLTRASELMCLCGGQEAAQDAVTAILEASRG